jgi:hypothetical protein
MISPGGEAMAIGGGKGNAKDSGMWPRQWWYTAAVRVGVASRRAGASLRRSARAASSCVGAPRNCRPSVLPAWRLRVGGVVAKDRALSADPRRQPNQQEPPPASPGSRRCGYMH